ncbi:MAG: CPBP family intramembrane metalloprotease [Dermabacter sp.]|nr:CPBP family intramembrane metalloprotease [Dermabacter sp.]
MVTFIVLVIPTLIYVVVQFRGRGRPGLQESCEREGATWGRPREYFLALALAVPMVGLGLLALSVIPTDVLEDPAVSTAQITSLGVIVAVVFRALGEEVFFRGLLGGIFIRRLGFGWGNVLQATVFLVPHLALVVVDARVWPLLPVQWVDGWILGWLRYRSDSFVPGTLIHAAANTAVGLAG